MKKIRVLVVEDSAVVREFLLHIIGRDERLEVCAAVSSAEEALRILEQVSPDVISLDVRLPGMNGLKATRRIMAQKPTPVVIVAGGVESEDLKITMKALEAGALAVLEKPAGITHRDYDALAERLCTQLVIMSQVKVVRQHPKPEPPNLRVKTAVEHRSGRQRPPPPPSGFAILGIASSTGGPGALMDLLNGLGADFPLPILLVQHMTASFMDGFASWLASVVPFSTLVVKDRQVPAAGTVYLAAADRHLYADSGYLRADSGEPVCGQRPSGTVLFQSMARTLGSQGIGIVLTGMGEDGAEGLLELRTAGGYTIAEDESTAVVYGMPAAAVNLGAACKTLPLFAIAPEISKLIASGRDIH
jgi:two-component system chemotaxis response regulator CheB